MSKLLWLTVNSSYSHSSLALPLVHLACRDQKNWEWLRYDTLIEDDPSVAAARIAEQQPDVISATLYLFNRNTALNILSRLSVLLPDTVLMCGGPECMGDGALRLLQDYPFLDLASSGEGEVSMPMILQALEHHGPLTGIPGVCCRDAATGVPITAALPAPIYEGWTEAPPPSDSPFFLTDKPFIQLETSRGCAQGCLYCCSGRSRVRYKSLDKVRQELQAVHDRGIREIRLLDRTFNVPGKRAAQLLHMFRTEFPDMRFHLEVHPHYLFPEIREEFLAARPGQLFIEAGLQSLRPEVQKAIGRNSSPEADLEGLGFLCSCTAFETHTDLISGLPEQTLDSIFEDIRQLLTIAPGEIQLEVLKMLPGTPMRAMAGILGMVYSPVPPYDVMATRTMSTADILTAKALSKIVDQFYNHPALQPVMIAACGEQPDTLKELLGLCREKGLTDGRPSSLRHRFELLNRFWTEDRYPAGREALAFAWLKAGFQPGESPADKTSLCIHIPEDAELLEGNAAVLNERSTRIFMLPGRSSSYYFAFNRAYVMNAPAAILQLHKND